MSLKPWKRVDPTIVTKVDYRNVVVKTFMLPGVDKPQSFATFLNEDFQAAGVIALTKDRQVIVARQFRPGTERFMDEVPGGGVENGEDPEVAARRELVEETGYEPGNMIYLGISSRDAYTNGRWHYYLATDCELSPNGQQLDENEQVEVKLISIDTLIENAKQDKMTDPVAVLMAYEKLLELKHA